MTYQEAYKNVTQDLEAANIPDAASDAWILLEHVTGMSRTRYYVDGFGQMKPEEEARYLELAEKRLKRIPVQHLTGIQEFMGMAFKVNEHVLVPRQDTEILVEEAESSPLIRGEIFSDEEREEFPEELLDRRMPENIEVLDMCTGSGCIIISMKKRNPNLKCTAVDLSEEALTVAKENAKRLGAEITFIQSDMFEDVQGKYDIIVSNPPYIPTKVIEELEEEVKAHDPFMALDGHEDGLYFYRILAKESVKHLKNGGYLYLEIGHDQKEAVEELLKEAGLKRIRTQKDLAGLDRVVSGVYNIAEEN
ncbi:MAG: peptide chain release factor N(5)-glutamine methyltransferase [Bariatricus sp.]|nr:peptide chain release factor N(5)-glutamine methyltransferase [Bariatricus sp.]